MVIFDIDKPKRLFLGRDSDPRSRDRETPCSERQTCYSVRSRVMLSFLQQRE
jgi:hypothetical protein